MSTSPQRRGTVLVVSIIVLFALASITLVLARSMRVEVIASANYAALLQASTIERGAEQYLLAMLTDQGSPSDLDESYFAGIPVGGSDPAGAGYFWVLRPDYGDPSLPVFGLTDESSKLNINVATFNQLMMLPCMTEDVAAAIVDWRDTDDDVSPGGAESEYYLSQGDGYYCKNAPFETVEELLLVRGATPELLYGSGPALPLGTGSLFSRSGSMLNDVWLQRGIYDLLTIYSSEPNTAPDGTNRVSLDRNQRTQLRELLRNQLGASRGDQIADAIGNDDVRDVFDLYFRAKLRTTELSQVADYISPTSSGAPTAQGAATPGGSGSGRGGQAQNGASGTLIAAQGQGQSQTGIRGRINVNTAPREVLLTIEQLEPADVDKLIAQRSGLSSTDLTSIGWVAEALGQKAIGLGARITGRGYQYSAHILAVSGNGRGFKQVRLIIDMRAATPQIVYRRDLTDRGWPMQPQILASLRAGQGPGPWAGASGLSVGGSLR